LNKRKAFQNAAILKKLKRKLRKSFFPCSRAGMHFECLFTSQARSKRSTCWCKCNQYTTDSVGQPNFSPKTSNFDRMIDKFW